MAGTLRQDNYVNIQGWMVTELGLKGNNLMIYAIIYGMSQDGKGRYTGGLKYLAEWTNSSKRGVMKNLAFLCENGYIAKEEKVINNIKFCEYYVPLQEKDAETEMIDKDTKFHSGEQSSTGYGIKFTGVVNKVPQGMEQSSPNNKYNNKTNNKNNTSSSLDDFEQVSDTGGEEEVDTGTGNTKISKKDIELVVERWNGLSKYGIKAVSRLDSSSKRYTMLCSRIRQYGLEAVLKAIESIKQSAFLQGNNKNNWMITFDWFVKPNNFPKVLEENYIDREKQRNSTEGGINHEGCTGRNDSKYQQAERRAYKPEECFGAGYDELPEFQGWED